VCLEKARLGFERRVAADIVCGTDGSDAAPLLVYPVSLYLRYYQRTWRREDAESTSDGRRCISLHKGWIKKRLDIGKQR
jgi:hypothetical protein